MWPHGRGSVGARTPAARLRRPPADRGWPLPGYLQPPFPGASTGTPAGCNRVIPLVQHELSPIIQFPADSVGIAKRTHVQKLFEYQTTHSKLHTLFYFCFRLFYILIYV